MKKHEHLLVIVPYRNRRDHLNSFLRRVWDPLHDEHANSSLLIAEQSDDERKFNRGQLLNSAMHYARRRLPPAARILLHDVDLEPSRAMRRLYYGIPSRVQAIAFGRRWGRYPGPRYFGGVVGCSPRAIWKANGFPNGFWGWGGEDDALYRRLRASGVRIISPREGTFYDLEQMTLREKLRDLYEKDAKCHNRHQLRNSTDGLDGLRYRFQRCNEPHRVVFKLYA